MRIAVCISGLPRFWTGFPKHKFGDVDYFIHTWQYKTECISDTCWYKYSENESEVHSSDWCDIQAINDFFKPKALIVEDYNKTTKDYFNLLTANFDTKDGCGRKSVLPMFYGIEKVIRSAYILSKANHTNYDIIVRCRFDTRLKSEMAYNKDNGIYIPVNNDFCGINDQFAYGDISSMLYYSEVYSNLIDSIIFNTSSKILLNPEVILFNHLKNCKITRFNQEVYLERL